MTDLNDRLGQLAIEQQFITPKQLERCRAAKAERELANIGQAMVELGFVTHEQLNELHATLRARTASTAHIPVSRVNDDPFGDSLDDAFNAAVSVPVSSASVARLANPDSDPFATVSAPRDADPFADDPFGADPFGFESSPAHADPFGETVAASTQASPIQPAPPMIPIAETPATVEPVSPPGGQGPGAGAKKAGRARAKAGASARAKSASKSGAKPAAKGAGVAKSGRARAGAKKSGATRVNLRRPGAGDSSSANQTARPGGIRATGAAQEDMLSEVLDDARALVGHEFAGCKVLELVGEGGMGTVYKVKHLFLNKVMAMKVLPPSATKKPQYVERFLREARSAAALDHPNIVHIFDVGEFEGQYYILMQFVEGKNLTQILKSQGKLSVADAVYIMKEVCKALAVAHDAGLVHRDIKPDNIMLQRNEVKVTDFGLAKQMDGGASEAEITMPGTIIGSPYFMAPELAEAVDIDSRTDLYSLGATVYYLITGKYPYEADTPLAVIFKHSREPLIPPHQRDPGVPRDVGELVARLMAKRKEDRPRSAAHVLRELEKLAVGRSSFEIGVGPETLEAMAGTQSGTGTGLHLKPLTPISSVDAPAVSHVPLATPVPPSSPRVVPGSSPSVVGSSPMVMTADMKAMAAAMAKQANTLLAQKNLDEAKALIAQGLSRFPADQAFQELRGRLPFMERESRLITALANAKAAIEEGDGVSAAAAIALIGELDGNHADLKGLKRDLAKLKSRVETLAKEGLDHVQAERLDEAVRAFRAVLKIDPEHRVATIQLRQLESRAQHVGELMDAARRFFREGDMRKARQQAEEAAAIAKDDPDAQAMLREIDEKQQRVADVLNRARESAASGDFKAAIGEARKALKIVPNATDVQASIESWEQARKTFDSTFATGKEAFDRKDYFLAHENLRSAQTAFPASNDVKKLLAKIEPLVKQRNELFRDGERLAAEGEIEKALAKWKKALEVCPGDSDIPLVMREADTFRQKTHRLQQQAQVALKRGDFDGALSAFEQLRKIEPDNPEVDKGIERATKKKTSRKRRRRLVAVMIVLLLVAGGIAGGGFYLMTQNQEGYALAKTEIETAIAEQDRDRLEAAIEQLRAVGFGLPVVIGVDDAERTTLLRRAENTRDTIDAIAARDTGDFDRAMELFRALAERAEDDAERERLAREADRVQFTRDRGPYDERIAELKAAILDLDKLLPDLPTIVRSTERMQAFEAAIEKTGAAYESLKRAYEGLMRLDAELASELTYVDDDETKRLGGLRAELSITKKLSAAIKALPAWEDAVWAGAFADGRALVELTDAALAAPFEPIRKAITAIGTTADGSPAWRAAGRYDALLAPLDALVAMLDVVDGWYKLWREYERAWRKLKLIGRPRADKTSKVVEAFELVRTLASDLSTAARALDGMTDPAMQRVVDCIQSEAWSLYSALDGNTSIVTHLIRLDPIAVVYVEDAAAGSACFMMLRPIDSTDFGHFVNARGYGRLASDAESYVDNRAIAYWEDYFVARGQNAFSNSGKVSIINQKFVTPRGRYNPGPAIEPSTPTSPVLGVSWGEANAYMQWRRGNESELEWRLPTPAELEAAIADGGDKAIIVGKEANREWVGGPTSSPNGPVALLVTWPARGGSASREFAELDRRDGTMTFRLASPFNQRPLARPVLRR